MKLTKREKSILFGVAFVVVVLLIMKKIRKQKEQPAYDLF